MSVAYLYWSDNFVSVLTRDRAVSDTDVLRPQQVVDPGRRLLRLLDRELEYVGVPDAPDVAPLGVLAVRSAFGPKPEPAVV